MKDLERNFMMPEDISLKRNNETRLLIKSIKELERYFYFLKDIPVINFISIKKWNKKDELVLLDEYLRILN